MAEHGDEHGSVEGYGRRLSRRLGAVVGAAVFLATTTAPTPADAGFAGTEAVPVHVTYSTFPPVTWVDGQGRQHLVAGAVTERDGTWEPIVARRLPSGEPDASWGTYSGSYNGGTDIGVRPLALSPPAGGLVQERALSIDDAGTLTTTWVPDGCAATLGTCDRWFQRATVEGATVGSPVLAPGDDRPVRALGDGSFLTLDPNGAPGWVGPDGVDRGVPAALDQVASAAVDRQGRLLAVATDGTVLRWTAGGPVDLALDAGCPSRSLVVGAATADDGFVTVCPATPDEPLAVVRRAPDGSPTWIAEPEPTRADGTATRATRALVDDEGRAWVGARGARPLDPSFLPTVFVQSFTQQGPGALAYWRESPSYGFHEESDSEMVSDLRATPAGIAVADELQCCVANGGGGPLSEVYGSVVVHAPVEPPTCTVTDLQLVGLGEGSAEISFATCQVDLADRTHQATGYRALARTAGHPDAVADGPLPEGGARPLASLPAPPGELTRITVAMRNQAGEGPVDEAIDVVAPFPTVEGFVARQHDDLLPSGADTTGRGADETAIEDLSATPLDVIDALLDRDDGRARRHVEPVARLYRTYFQRDPDPSGLRYWVRQREVRGTSLSRISSVFADSSEFRATYGSLTNRGYVAQLYRNAFGREPDAGGLDFWTRRLDARRIDRGGVVLQFSESSEGTRLAAPDVEPDAVAWLMLGRLPTATEQATWASLADPHREVAAAIVATAEYRARVTG